ncbi:hypothetical protein [Burkholderia ubonensis]|uniref:hypothetical protein n=1 Tax=Burkholderia ubonensis TaxID=101571 RepID=UPI000A8E4DC3|nr:hypothetical protein [Burkholderia ubonensis]
MVKRTRVSLAVALALSWMLTGCASGTTPTPALVAVMAAHPQVRASLLTTCPDELPAAADGELVTLLRNHVDAAVEYHACRNRQADLVQAIRSQKGIDIAP